MKFKKQSISKKLSNNVRLNLLRIDAEIRSCYWQLAVKQKEMDAVKAKQEEWKLKYKKVMTKMLEKYSLDLSKFNFDDETGELVPVIIKE